MPTSTPVQGEPPSPLTLGLGASGRTQEKKGAQLWERSGVPKSLRPTERDLPYPKPGTDSCASSNMGCKGKVSNVFKLMIRPMI